MKTSFKILLPTMLFLFIMIFAIYFNVKAEINKYRTGEQNITKNTINNFSNIVVNTKSTVYLYISDNNTVYGDVNLNNYKVLNDTLFISDTTLIKIDFKNIKSITSNYGSNITIDSINTNSLKIINTNNSEININKGVIKRINIMCDSSQIYLKRCKLNDIKGELMHNSTVSFNSKINSINIKSDTSSNFSANRWRLKY